MDLTRENVREAVRSLSGRAVIPVVQPDEVWDGWQITMSSVVLGPRGSWLHLNTFKDLVDEETYNRVLAQPRVVHPYDLSGKED